MVRLSSAIWQGWRSLWELSKMPRRTPTHPANASRVKKTSAQEIGMSKKAEIAPYDPLIHFACPDPACYQKKRQFTVDSLLKHM